MDARAADSDLTTTSRTSWLERERVSGRLYRWAAIVTAVVLVGTALFSFWILREESDLGSLLSPLLVALLLVANLIPAIVLMVLFARRIALRRAASFLSR